MGSTTSKSVSDTGNGSAGAQSPNNRKSTVPLERLLEALYISTGLYIWLETSNSHKSVAKALSLYLIWLILSLGRVCLQSLIRFRNAPSSDPPGGLGTTASPSQDAEVSPILTQYNRTWNSLLPHEQNWPFPNPFLTIEGFYAPEQRNFFSGCGLTYSQLIILIVQRFFLHGYGITFKFDCEGPRWLIMENSTSKVGQLRKYLKLKELPRWHPDWLGRRTGVEGLRDEGLGTKPGIKPIRTGVEELIEKCEEFLKGE